MLFAGINAFGNVLEGDDDSHGNQQRNSGPCFLNDATPQFWQVYVFKGFISWTDSI